MEYKELSFSNLTSILLGWTLTSIWSVGVLINKIYDGRNSGLIKPSYAVAIEWLK